MKLGYLTPYSEKAIKLAAEVGLGCIEMGCWPNNEMNADNILSGGAEEVLSTAKKYGIQISSLGYYGNNLDSDISARKASNDYLKKLIDSAVKLNVKMVNTFAGRVESMDILENIPVFKGIFTPLVKYAEDRGVKIAIENCPMFHGWPFTGVNIAYSPEAWAAMFEAVDSPNLGLEFDPSHLYWLGMDYISLVKDFGEKIYHVHAKDTEILTDKFAYTGIYGKGWWRYRIPGWGEIDWKGFISALYDAGYDGAVDIEHEDPVFEGDRFDEGIKLGYMHLHQYIL